MGKLERVTYGGVTLVGGADGAVRFGFTERTGGVSNEPYASLNLGSHVNDDPAAVKENRRRVLSAMGAGEYARNLVVPNQVHGDVVQVVRSADPSELDAVRARAAEGTDAVVCTAPSVPVMLMFADCVPVIITGPGGFAVAHSGWRGTYAGIAGKTARILSDELGVTPDCLRAYIGPHILGDEYEVSEELVERFAARFSSIKSNPKRLLDLSSAIVESLAGAGVDPANIEDPALSTVRLNDRFYSYRAEHGTTGRHAAVAYMTAQQPMVG